MNNLELMGFGATKFARGLILIITLGFCDMPYDTNYALRIAQRHYKRRGRKAN